MFAKIVQKDTSSIKEKAWARKVVLPTEKDFDKELTYDLCTQKIRYNRVVTSKCLNGCFIVFGVTTKDNFEEYQNLFTLEYSIIPRFIKRGKAHLDQVSIKNSNK